MNIPEKYLQMKVNNSSPVEVFVEVYRDTADHGKAIDYISLLFDIPDFSQQIHDVIREAYTEMYDGFLKMRDAGIPPQNLAQRLHYEGVPYSKAVGIVGFVYKLNLMQIKAVLSSAGYRPILD